MSTFGRKTHSATRGGQTVLKALTWAIPLLFLVIFFYQPMAAIIRLVFAEQFSGGWQLINAGDILRPLEFTFSQAALSTLLTLLLGIPAAYLFSHYKFAGKNLLNLVSTLPFILPTVVVAAGFNALLGPRGLLNLGLMGLFELNEAPIRFVNSIGAILVVHVFYNITIVIRIVSNAMASLDQRLAQAAKTLGATPMKVLTEITLPLLTPAVLSATLLVFLFDFTSFGVILLMGGPGMNTIEVAIYKQVFFNLNLPLAGLLSIVQLVITFGVTILYNRVTHRNPAGRLQHIEPITPVAPKTRGAKAAIFVLVVLLLLFIVSPMAALVGRSFSQLEPARGEGGDFRAGISLAYYRELFSNRQDSLFYVPPLLAIMTAIIFRHVILCLVLGIVAGGVLVIWPTDQLAVWGVWHAFYYYFLRHAILDAFRIEIISFVLLICAIVGLAQHSGGINSVINWLMRFCRTARAARITTALIGLMVFFDDYMNCIIVGNALRPLTDRYRVSRAKLAYIVDSTAAPVAGLALVSTWIAFELSQITEGLVAARISAEPFEVFIRTIPYRFYCWFTLILVFVIASMGRDYGPMLAAERRALTDAPPDDAPSEEGRPSGPNGRAMYAILPIGLTLVAIVVGLWWTAQPGPGESPIVADGLLDYLQQTLGRANSARAFSRASAFGYLFALALVLGGKAMTFRQAMRASFVSIRAILGAIVILLLAWSIGAACRDVGTADYLVAMFHSVLNPVGFSLIIFGLSCLVAFATGSSYSTMAILLPNVVPLALAVGEGSALGGMALIVMSIGAVLEGAIFGDHCSPISDTTILSSISSRCDLIEHVRTQMPYGLTGMIIAVVVGYTPVALGAPPVLCLASGAAVLILVVRVLGQRTVPSDSSAA